MYIQRFKENIAPQMANYDLSYRFFEEGDFGDLNQIEFNSEEAKMGGEIDFWSSGCLYIHLVDYSTESELMNIFLEQEETVKQEDNFCILLSLLRK